MKAVILLVDDNEDILSFLQSDLEEDYTILLATNGVEALAQLEEHNVQLIVTDIMMPCMDGMELCRRIKSNFNYSHIPIILLTAKNTFQSKIEGLETGADAYIDKPFSPEYLQAQIANLLNNRSKLKEYFANSPLVHIRSMAVSKEDGLFLENLNVEIQAHLGEADLDVDTLAKNLNMSRPSFYRKVKGLSNLTPKELVNIARLKKAVSLMIETDLQIRQIALEVGFSSSNHLTRNFFKQFNMTPSDYIRSNNLT